MSYNRPPAQPPSGYPPQGQPFYPSNPGYGAPPGGYAPPQQGGYYPPGPYGGYPQEQPVPFGYPPPQQGGYSRPPPGPPGAGPYGGYPPPGPAYGAPPPAVLPAGYSPAPPAGPSLGYIPNQVAPGDFTPQADALRKAMKGFGTNDEALISILAHLDPLQMAAVRETYARHLHRDLYHDVKGETSGYYEQGLLAIVQGPLINDAELVHDAVKGAGTKEWLLNDVLLARSNADLCEIKNAYHQKYHRSLEKAVEDDLSAETKALFARVISATRNEESTPINPMAIENAAMAIHSSTSGRMINDTSEVCIIFARSSDNELRAISHAFHQRYHVDLEKHISKQFSGHLKHALIYMLHSATDPAFRDAAALEDCMSGPGTKDFKLVTRIVRLHWNKPHLELVKRAYHHHYKRQLRDRVRGETSGDYRHLMLALLD